MDVKKFKAETCECCTQTKNYAIAIDRGSALTMLAIANAVHRLGRNRVHIANEMIGVAHGQEELHRLISEGYMTLRMLGNIPRPRYHGLIAFADRGSGEYLITRKGSDFLKGMQVPRVAIIDKVHGKNDGYWPEGGATTLMELIHTRNKMWDWNLTEVRNRIEIHTGITATLPL